MLVHDAQCQQLGFFEQCGESPQRANFSYVSAALSKGGPQKAHIDRESFNLI